MDERGSRGLDLIPDEPPPDRYLIDVDKRIRASVSDGSDPRRQMTNLWTVALDVELARSKRAMTRSVATVSVATPALDVINSASFSLAGVSRTDRRRASRAFGALEF
ncbi:MAG: hypothetical protein AAGJ87_09630 [Pseudomonadota bacterium]